MNQTTSGNVPGWCLRFQSGPLRGRTIALRPGVNIVGSSGECEVMLPGGDVLPKHLALTVGELVVSAQKIGAASAQVNGAEMAQQRRSLVAGDVLTLGNIDVQLDRSYPVQEQDDRMFAPTESVLPGTAQPAPAARPARLQPHMRVAAGLLGLAVVGLIMLGVHQLAGSSRGGVARGGVDMVEVDKAIADFPEVEAVSAPGGQIVLRGYVESRARKAALQQAMQPHGSRVAVHVHTAEDMVEQARQYVSDPGVAIAYAGNGRLVVSGTVDDDAVREKIRRLAEDLHPNVLVSDKLQYLPKPRKEARTEDADWDHWQSVLPARMVSITDDGNGLRHIQLSNGTRYYEGSVLRSGAELKRIESDGLVLGTDKQATDAR